MNVAKLIQIANANPSKVAREAGIARSRLNRIATNKTMPSIETLREIALTLGLDVELRVKNAADPGAAHAARCLLDKHVSEADPAWLERFERWNLAGRELLEKAGRLSNPTGQPEAQYFGWAANVDVAIVAASAAAGVGKQWALSGAAAQNFWLGTGSPGPTIVWTIEPERCSEPLERTLPRTAELEPSGVVVVRAAGTELVDRAQDDPLFYAAPIQTALDLYELELDPSALTEGWFDD